MADREDIPDRKELLAQQFDAEEEQMVHGPSEEVPIKRTETQERERGADGKFVAKAKEEPEAKEPEPKVEVEEPEKEPPVWARPPKSWKPEHRAKWEAIADQEIRQIIHTREDQMRAGVEPLIPKAKFADEINEVLQPYMPTIRGLGVQPKDAIAALMRADHALRTLPPDQKRNYLVRLAADYGVNLGQPGSPSEMPPAQAGQDPRLFALQNELVNLKGSLAEFQQRQEEAVQQSTLHEINNFAKGVEFFEEAKPVMIQLLQSGMATDLSDAYQKALRLDSDLYEKVQAKTQHAQIAAKHNAAQKAKAAAVSPRSATPGGTPTSTKAQSRREMLLEQFGSMDSRL